MKGLTWVGVFVSIGIAAGTIAFALTTRRYRGVTTLQVKAVPDDSESADSFRQRLDGQVQGTMQAALDENRMERLIQEFDLDGDEDEEGYPADALIALRESTSIARHADTSEAVERWDVAFEAADPALAEAITSRLALMIETDANRNALTVEMVGSGLYEDLETQWIASKKVMDSWVRAHGDSPAPPAMARQHKALSAAFDEFMERAKGLNLFGYHRRLPIQAEFEIVGTTVSETRVGPALVEFAAAGAALGVVAGVITLPFLVWWHRYRRVGN